MLLRRLINIFPKIYNPKKNDPGREWPPRISRVIQSHPSEYPTFSNVLIHVNGARIDKIKLKDGREIAQLIFDHKDKNFNLSVIDGQH